MRRREFITLLGGAPVAWPLASRAQPLPVQLKREAYPDGQARIVAFQQKLAQLGTGFTRCIWSRVSVAHGGANQSY